MPIIVQDPFIRPNENDILWRYIDLEKFESLLKEKSLFFCRADKFSDPFEGSVPMREVEYRLEEYRRINKFYRNNISEEIIKERSNSIGELHKKWRRSFIVNCWHLNEGESDAMWRLYLKTNEGVAVQSTVTRLKQAFALFDGEIFLSKVRYIDYDKDIWYDKTEYPEKSYSLFSPIVHKRKAFIHESELRIFQKINEAENDDNYWALQPNVIGRLIPVDIDELIDKIILPPTSDSLVKQKVEELLKKYHLKKEIVMSKLTDCPYY